MKCKKCNFDNPVPMKFCGQCGVELQVSPTLSEEKRLVTVLFADLSGFTRLSRELEPEEVSEVSNHCFERLNPIITKRRGVIHKYEGDLVIALFGVPVSHEDDPEQAVYAALELMAAAPAINQGLSGRLKKDTRLSLHVGISSGTVALGEIGSIEKKEYTVMGSVVNLASRVKDAAKAGEVLVSEAVFKATRYLFDYEAIPPVAMKGMEEAVSVFKPLGKKKKPDPKRGIAGLQSVLVGREGEVKLLKKAINDLVTGKWRVISIIGPAGIGKTRLFDEIKRSIALDRGTLSVLEASCLVDGEIQPNWPFLQILAQVFDIGEQDPATAVKEKLLRGMREVFDEGWEQHYPYIALLFSGRLEDSSIFEEKVRHLEAKALRLQVLLSIRSVLLELTKERPAMIAIDDYHWIDPASLETIEFIVNGPEHGPLLLVLLSRAEKENEAWRTMEKMKQKTGDRFLEIVLNPLDRESSRQLAENLLRIPGIPDDFKTMILERSAGNPFFLEEILRHFIDRGALFFDNGSWKLRSEQAFDVPDTIQAVIQARLGRLDPDLRRLLQVASVIGIEFDVEVLERVAALEPLELSILLATLEEFEYVARETGTPAGDAETYVFKHPLIQEVVYRTLFKKGRRELHDRVGRCIEELYGAKAADLSEVLARQYYAAADYEKGLKYSLMSARKAADAYLNKAALKFYAWAVECAEMAGCRQDLVIGLKEKSLVLNRVGDNDRALKDIRRAITLAKKSDDNRLHADCLIRLSEIHEALSNYRLMTTSAGEALLLYEMLGDKKGVAESLNNIGAAFFYLGDHSKAQDFHEKALKIRQELGDANEQAISLLNIGSVLAGQRDSRRASEFYGRALAIAEETGNLKVQAASLNNLGFVVERLGESRKALDFYQRSLKIKAEMGDRWGQATSLNNIGGLLGRLGEHAAALECFTKSLGMFQEIGGRRGEAINWRSMAMAYLALGDGIKAREFLGNSEELALELGDKELMRRALTTRAEIEIADLNLERAKLSIAEARRLAGELKSKAGLGEVFLLSARQALARGDHAAADKDFIMAISIFEEFNDPFELAKVLYYYCESLMRRRENAKAGRVAERATALFKQVGAEAWLKRMVSIGNGRPS